MYVDNFEDYLDEPLDAPDDEDAEPCDFCSNPATFRCRSCGALKCNECNDEDGGESARGIGGRCLECDNNFTFEKL